MGKIKRKPRNKLSKKFNVMNPIEPMTLEKLGTADDPCFGKHQDPRTAECSRCGDSEICAIVMQQNNNLKRAEIEAKQKFKDLEEKDTKLADPKLIRNKVRFRLKELAKLKPKGQSLDYIVDDIHSTYVMHGYTKKKIKRLILKWIEASERLSIDGNLIKYHKK